MEVISVEWLLLQNPREPFSPRRPRLPGQQHPGLGLLRDFMGWLVVVCEAHQLDGVFFVAAHYHVAMQSRRLVRPLLPEDEARLAAMAEALAGVPLPEATSLVEEGRLVDAATGQPFDWRPVPTVLPVSERLRALVSGPEYEEAAAAAAPRFACRVGPRPRRRRARLREPAVGGRIGSSANSKEPLGCPRAPPPPLLSSASPPSSSLSPRPPPPGLSRNRRRSLRPRLVVFVSVDQMRADYLVRFRPLFTSGLKAIAEQGAVFTNARYRHACTETGPGHSSCFRAARRAAPGSWATPGTTAPCARG